MRRIFLFVIPVFAVSGPQLALAQAICSLSDGKLNISDATPAVNVTSCTLHCMLLRNNAQVDASCIADVKAGETGHCTVTGLPGDEVLGAASVCGDAAGPQIDGPFQSEPP